MQKTKLAVTVFVLVLALTTVSLAQTPTQMPDRTKPLVKLNLTIVGAGTVEPAPKPPTYPEYQFGTKVTLTAKPADGWQFICYEGAVKSTAPVVTFKMNGNKQVKATFKLLPPTIVNQSADQTVADGNTATFSVQALGAQLRYQWRANGSMIPRATSSCLTFATAPSNDGSEYTCQVSNPAGKTDSSGIKLTVYPEYNPVRVGFASDPSDKDCYGVVGSLLQVSDDIIISFKVPIVGNQGQYINIADPTNLVIEPIAPAIAGASWGLGLFGPYKLIVTSVMEGATNRIYDFSNPREPILMSEIYHMRYCPPAQPYTIRVNEVTVINQANVILVDPNMGAVLYDMTDPEEPVMKSWLVDYTSGYYPNGVVYDGDQTVFIAGNSGIVIAFNITNWQQIASFDVGRPIQETFLKGKFLYTHEGFTNVYPQEYFWVCRDVSNLSEPVITDEIESCYYDNYVRGNVLFQETTTRQNIQLQYLSSDGRFIPIGEFEPDTTGYIGKFLVDEECMYVTSRGLNNIFEVYVYDLK